MKTQLKLNKYTGVAPFKDGIALVRADYNEEEDIYGYIDVNGYEVVPLKYEYARSFNDGLAEIQLEGKIGFIDRNFKEYFFEEDKLVYCDKSTVVTYTKYNETLVYKIIGCYGFLNINAYFGTKDTIVAQIKESVEENLLDLKYAIMYIDTIKKIEKEYK